MSHHADTNTVARTLHELGLAAWFGGALMGAVALNPASGEVDDPGERLRVANAAWGRWMPVAAVAVSAHLFGAVKLTTGNAGRIAAQQGVATMAAAKAGLTGAALAATVASGVYGRKVMQLEAQPPRDGKGPDVEDATTPSGDTPPEVAAAMRKLALLQWAIPALTCGLVVLSARMGEQQRPTEVVGGFFDRLIPGR